MSEVLSNETPEAPPADLATATVPPGGVEAVVEGSAETAPATVDAKRFNGLMSAHQTALDALKVERDARIALEARLQEENKPVPETDQNEVALLRRELAEQRAESARAAALAKYPEAAPFADLIQGNTAAEVEGVAAAIAQRIKALNPTAPVDETEVVVPVVEVPAPVVVPVITGGAIAPGEPSRHEELQEALKKGDWNGFWAAKTTPSEAANLA